MSTYRRESRWLWLSLLPLGLGSWAPIMLSLRCGVRRWTVLGVPWSICVFVGWALAAVEPTGSGAEDLSGGLIILGWCGAIVTSWWIRRGCGLGTDAALPDHVRWLEPTARSRQLSVRYALFAYVVTFVGVSAVAAVLYFGVGVSTISVVLAVFAARLPRAPRLLRRFSSVGFYIGVCETGSRSCPLCSLPVRCWAWCTSRATRWTRSRLRQLSV